MKASNPLFLCAAAAVGSLIVPAFRAQAHIAFVVQEGQPGNQPFGGALGLEFNVVSPIIVSRLGCFDDMSDGLYREIQVRLYDRLNPEEPLAIIDFWPDDPGTPEREDGELTGGSRFLPLAEPLELPAGFQGIIVASNYGAEERNGNNSTITPWTMDTGGGLLSFAGCQSIWGNDPFGYPNVADGPVNSYAAGTFEFSAADMLLPAYPSANLSSGAEQVSLAWGPVTEPVPAVSYRILRALAADGVFTQIAEVTTTEHVDTGLTNGVEYLYKLVSVAAGDVTSAESPVIRAAPYQIAENHHIAYFTPAYLIGNQNFSGTLGLDFDVQNPIIVTRLGVYDSGSDGILPSPGPDNLPGTEDDEPRVISARLYNRETLEPLAWVDFTTEDPGTLVAGMRFKELAEPIELPAGFLGCMVAEGYGIGELLRNSLGQEANMLWTLDNGEGSLLFTGTGRYGVIPGEFPEIVDASLAAAYAAGTFEFRTTAATVPGKPEITLNPRLEDGAATLVWTAVTTPLPAASYRVYRYDEIEDVYTFVAETPNLTHRVTGLPNGETVNFVVRGVADGGQEGLSSNLVTTTPAAIEAGVAYTVFEGAFGNQEFNGSLGLDFDVVNPIRVTRLGAFDSGADGLYMPITVAIYDRQTGEAVTPLIEFAIDDPGTVEREDGELIEGSRFITLPAPLELPAGFQGSIVAYGYGLDEPNGNAGAGFQEWTTFSGGSLVFVGGGRWDNNHGVLPTTIDAGPANRYAAGTFAFEPAGTTPPATEHTLTITPLPPSQVRLDWIAAPGLILQRSPNLTSNSWQTVEGATPGYTVTVDGIDFFRLATLP